MQRSRTLSRAATGLGIVAIGAAIALPTLGAQSTPFAVSVTTSPNPYAILGETSVSHSSGILGYGTGTSDVGLQGYATQAGSTGLEGFASATSGATSDGVYGYAGNGVGLFGVGASATSVGVYGSAPSQGVYGTSSAGNGVFGVTKNASTPAAGAIPAGVFGEDEQGSASNAGVVGKDLGAGAGVIATSMSGIGVEGASVNGEGVQAYSENSNALVAESDSASSILATSALDDGYAIEAHGTGNVGTGVYGATDDGFGVYGVAKNSNYDENGIGVEGVTDNALGVGVEAVAGGTAGIALVAQSTTANTTGFELDTYYGTPIKVFGTEFEDSPTAEIMELDVNGNLTLRGSLTQDGSPASTARDGRGRKRVTYSPQDTAATVEDVGEARLVDGRAAIPLESSFASLIAPGSTYLVFLTPQGETPGLYVASKSAGGFVVQEYGRRSSIAFDYRIVATPRAAVGAPRLALFTGLTDRSHVTLQHPPAPHRVQYPTSWRRALIAGPLPHAPRAPALPPPGVR